MIHWKDAIVFVGFSDLNHTAPFFSEQSPMHLPRLQEEFQIRSNGRMLIPSQNGLTQKAQHCKDIPFECIYTVNPLIYYKI